MEGDRFLRFPSVEVMRRLVCPAVLALAACLALAGCDTSFDAFEETDRAYSVFGYLDANADTQSVRVEPFQDSAFVGSGSEAPLDARVTTENVATGETAVWTDRVDRLGANGVPVHNFTTTAEIAPEATYRFRVEGEAGVSTAEVTLPPAFSRSESIANPPVVPQTCGETSATPTTLQFEGLARLEAVRVDYDYLEQLCGPPVPPKRVRRTFYPLDGATRTGDSTWTVRIRWSEQIPERSVYRVLDIYTFRVTVAAASADWPEFAADNPPGGGAEGAPLPPPGRGTNIEGGTGFLGGAFTRTVAVPVFSE